VALVDLDPVAGAREQTARRQSGEARADDDHVGRRIVEHGASVEFVAGMTDRFALSYADHL
jgi:hypothetical protein